MDWNRYKQICDTPNVFSRWMLEQTSELTSTAIAHRLKTFLAQAPITKPDDHRGGFATDMIELSLSAAEIELIIVDLRRAESAGRRSSATAGRGLGGFQEAWNEYLTFLAEDLD